MIRTATGIALLILIAIYGLMFLRRESFTSTIDFVTVIDAFQKMTDDEKTSLMQTGKRVMEQLGESLLTKMSTAPITNADANQIVNTINKSINTEFTIIINKYKLNSVDIISLVIYAIAAAATQSQGGAEMTPIVKQNLETLALFVKNWNPNGKSLPSVALASASASPGQAPASASASASSKASASIPTSSSSGSLFTGNINDIIKGAVRDELKTIANQPSDKSQFAYAPGTSFSYDGGAAQNWQQNAACNARDWCCRCRRPRHRCNC